MEAAAEQATAGAGAGDLSGSTQLTGSHPARAGEGGGMEEMEPEGGHFDLSHETLTTCVATWILSPLINASVVSEIDSLAALEMK